MDLPLYDGPEAESFFSRSHSRWQAALRTAASTRHLPANSFDLETILSRTPSLPRHIPSDATTIEGYSSWTNSDPLCGLEKTGKIRRFVLRKTHVINCRISLAPDFSAWEDTPNNVITLLVLAWSYILTADLAERQCLGMEYLPRQPSNSQLPTLRLDYALPQERAWWKAIVARGIGWSIASKHLPHPKAKASPWAVQVEDTYSITQRPSFCLTCRHRLCKPCAAICCRLNSESGMISQCPLCLANNDRRIELSPSTAGLRVLELGGTINDRFEVLRFLKDLDRHIEMKTLPLSQNFDIVIGSDIGTLYKTRFILGLF